MLDIFNNVGSVLIESLTTPRGLAISMASALGLGLVLAASFARTMVKLRALTVMSNICLLTSAALAPNVASMMMFAILIPLNSYRLLEIVRLTRKMERAVLRNDLSGIWLKPYMKVQRLPTGSKLFSRGDPAEALYLLVEGELELEEIGKLQLAGELFGEIAFFSPDGKRTLTARCRTDCELLSISGPMFRQLYFQSPKLAFQVSELIAMRLSADIERLQGQLRSRPQHEHERIRRAAAPAPPVPDEARIQEEREF